MSGSRARLLLTLTCAAGLVPAAQAQARTDSAVAGAVRYLRAAQNPDGGLGPEPGLRSTTLYGAWSAIGLAAAGVPCSSARRDGGRSLASYTAAYAPSARMTGDVERAMLALGACGVPVPHALRTRLAAARRPDGSYGGQVNYTAFAVLALRATGTRASDPAIHAAGRWLSTQAADDGAFNYGGRGASGDVDDTGAVLEALVAAGRPRSSRVAQRAVRFILTHQGDDGGFGGSRSNAQSTAFGVQGLLAMGTDVDKVLRSGNSPLHYLRSLQDDRGAIHYSRTTNQTPVWVTAQALAALAGRPLPITP